MPHSKYREHVIAFIEFIVKDDTYALFDPDDKLVATLKRHEYLSQPQLRRIGNSHGRYRKSNSPLRGSTSGKSGRTGPIGTTFHAFPITFTAAGGTISDYSGYDAIENSGIRAGEITACRCWWHRDGRLFSVYMYDCEWLPNTPMVGDVFIGHGVHGFKDRTDLFMYTTLALFSKNVFSKYNELVTGTVSMWGEMVEHERGYRAQYAKIISLDTKDEYLRRKFGV